MDERAVNCGCDTVHGVVFVPDRAIPEWDLYLLAGLWIASAVVLLERFLDECYEVASSLAVAERFGERFKQVFVGAPS